MRGQLSYLVGNLTLLKQMNWIDRQTRAVFAEFTAYNPNINLLMVATVLIEFLPSGSILTSARFDPLNLFNEIGSMALFKTIFEFAFVSFVVYFMVREVRSVARTGPKTYAKEFWNYIEWSIIICAWTSFGMFIYRIQKANDVLDFFKNTAGYGYMNMQRVNECNQMLTCSLGLCAAFGSVKFLRLFRFNRRISYLGSTLKLCLKEMLSFSVIFFLVWISFVQLMHLIFGAYLEAYSTLVKSMDSAFQIMLGKFDVSQFMLTNPVLGPIIFSAYNIMIVFILLNIFVSIVVEAFEQVRSDSAENEFDVFEHVLERLKKHFSNAPEELLSPDKYKDHVNVLPNRVNRLIEYVKRVIFCIFIFFAKKSLI